MKQYKAVSLRKSSDHVDVIRMQTGFGLIKSMLRSKTLTVMVFVGILFMSGFIYFLLKMAGA